MRTAALLVLLIVSGLFLLPEPLPLPLVWLALPALPLLCAKRWPGRWLGIALLALALATAHVHWLFSWQLPVTDIQRDVRVLGRIVSLPEAGERSQRFLFQLEQFGDQTLPSWSPATLRLSWYEPAEPPKVGERWQFTVRLKPPRGSLNFHGFDYERWLFAQHVRATGYVRTEPAPIRFADPAGAGLQSFRQHLRDRVLALPLQHGAVIAGLSFGADDAISQEAWRLLRDTGTTHLVAISGLHVTLMAVLAGFVVAGLWRQLPRAPLFVPAPQIGIMAGLLCATLYSALAGFSTPTVRALLMLAVVAAGWLWRRQLALSTTLASALVLLILLDPCALLTPGFWLSFAAVAWLFLIGSGRPIAAPWWHNAGRMQLLLSIGLLPLTLLWFGQASLISPLANLLAVPWVSFVSTPLALAGCALLSIWPDAATVLLHGCDATLSGFFAVMQWLAQWPMASWQPPALSLPALLALAITSVLLLAPWTPARPVALLLLLLPISEWALPQRPATPRVTMLDVGQGTALIMELSDAVLVYDTGPRGERFDAGEQIVLPALRAAGWSQLDQLWVSHADNDHAGGAEALLTAMPVRQRFSGEPLPDQLTEPCHSGPALTLSAAHIEVLHPIAPDRPGKANDRSCVIRITVAGWRLLLVGDITAEVEAELLTRYPDRLAADILLVPHHGSAGSSSPAFVQAVAPRWALISAGYRNPHRHPRPEVVARYRARGTGLFDTTRDGAVALELGADGVLNARTARAEIRLWRRSPDAD